MHISNQLQAFSYHGSKFSYLSWLLPLLPDCKHYVDVFGGSGAVLLNRKPALIETFNDKNEKVVNFFKVLRNQPDELILLLELTPHSKKEYDDAWECKNDTPLEKARKFFVSNQQSIWAAGSQQQLKGWTSAKNESRRGISDKTNLWLNRVDGLKKLIERLRNVQIENRDFRFIMQKYDGSDHLLYLDSPYDQTFRSATVYEFDFVNQDFFDLHYYARNAKGKVAISGYNSEFMMELFKEFNFIKGPKRKNTRSDKEAYECLWTNY